MFVTNDWYWSDLETVESETNVGRRVALRSRELVIAGQVRRVVERVVVALENTDSRVETFRTVGFVAYTCGGVNEGASKIVRARSILVRVLV